MRQRFAPSLFIYLFAHFKNQTTRKTEDEHGFIAQHKLNQMKCLSIQITTARILNSFCPTSHIAGEKSHTSFDGQQKPFQFQYNLELKHTYFFVFNLLFVLMIKVYNNAMARPRQNFPRENEAITFSASLRIQGIYSKFYQF